MWVVWPLLDVLGVLKELEAFPSHLRERGALNDVPGSIFSGSYMYSFRLYFFLRLCFHHTLITV